MPPGTRPRSHSSPFLPPIPAPADPRPCDAAPSAVADELAREREFLAALLEHIGDGIVACDAAGTTTLCNSVLQGFYGLSAPPATAAERQAVRDSMHAADGVTRLRPEELPLARAFAGETVRDMEVVIVLPGRPRRHLLARGQAITHPDGRKLGAVVAFRDVSEARRAAAALAESERRFRTVVESMDEGVIITDLDDVIQHVNPSALALTGYALDELLGRAAFATLIPREAHGEFRERMRRRRSGVAERYEVEHVRKDGTRIWVEVSGVPLTDTSGAVVGTLGTLTDITARKAHERDIVLAKEAAEAASRAKSDFLARMSHELRTPLNSVIGFADVLRRNQAGNQRPQDVRMLDRVAANGRHLLGLINDILDLSKIEAGRLTPELTPVRCDALVAETVSELEGAAAGKAITLAARVPARVAPVLTDRTRLKQILVNLVGNAVKFTERGGVTVTLVVGDADGRPQRIEVADTGIGIAPERQAQVFGTFEQADPSVTRKYGGTGLGLAISRALCEALGYALELRSELGRGSTFCIVFEPGTAAPASAASAAG
jgi:PAS domain S-box-containing protein